MLNFIVVLVEIGFILFYRIKIAKIVRHLNITENMVQAHRELIMTTNTEMKQLNETIYGILRQYENQKMQISQSDNFLRDCLENLNNKPLDSDTDTETLDDESEIPDWIESIKIGEDQEQSIPPIWKKAKGV